MKNNIFQKLRHIGNEYSQILAMKSKFPNFTVKKKNGDKYEQINQLTLPALVNGRGI